MVACGHHSAELLPSVFGLTGSGETFLVVDLVHCSSGAHLANHTNLYAYVYQVVISMVKVFLSGCDELVGLALCSVVVKTAYNGW